MNKKRGSLLIEILLVMPLMLSISYALLASEKLAASEIYLASKTEEIANCKYEVLSLLSGGMPINEVIKINRPYVIKIIRQGENGNSYVLSVENKDSKEEIYWYQQ